MQLPLAETTLTSTDISISLDIFEEGVQAILTCDYNSFYLNNNAIKFEET